MKQLLSLLALLLICTGLKARFFEYPEDIDFEDDLLSDDYPTDEFVNDDYRMDLDDYSVDDNQVDDVPVDDYQVNDHPAEDSPLDDYVMKVYPQDDFTMDSYPADKMDDFGESKEHIFESNDDIADSNSLIKAIAGRWRIYMSNYCPPIKSRSFEVAILSTGELFCYGGYWVRSRITTSDDQISYKTSDGWLKINRFFAIAAYAYIRLKEDGRLEVKYYCNNSTSYKGYAAKRPTVMIGCYKTGAGLIIPGGSIMMLGRFSYGKYENCLAKAKANGNDYFVMGRVNTHTYICYANDPDIPQTFQKAQYSSYCYGGYGNSNVRVVYRIFEDKRSNITLNPGFVGRWDMRFPDTTRNDEWAINYDSIITMKDTKLFLRTPYMTASDNQLQFPSAEGWLKVDNLYKHGTWGYIRYINGIVEIHCFADVECKQTYMGLKNYCYKGIGTKEAFESVGCYNDKTDDPAFKGYHQSQSMDIVNCYLAAKEAGNDYFAIGDSGKCFANDSNAAKTYNRYGSTEGCLKGQGGIAKLDVYRLTGCDIENGGCQEICIGKGAKPQCGCATEGTVIGNDGTSCVHKCNVGNGGCGEKCIENGTKALCACTTEGTVIGKDGISCVHKCNVDNGGCGEKCIENGTKALCACTTAGTVVGKDGKSCVHKCNVDNGGCGEKCIEDGTKALCACTTEGKVIGKDGKSCVHKCNVNNGGCGEKCIEHGTKAICACTTEGTVIGKDGISCVHKCNVDNGGCGEKCIENGTEGICACTTEGTVIGKDGISCVHKCNVDNGGCDEKCIENGTKALCTCTTEGKVIGKDGKSCVHPCDVNNGGCEETCDRIGIIPLCTCTKDSTVIAKDGISCVHPCDVDNGDCEEICDRTGKRAVCKCFSPDKVLTKDGKSCVKGYENHVKVRISVHTTTTGYRPYEPELNLQLHLNPQLANERLVPESCYATDKSEFYPEQIYLIKNRYPSERSRVQYTPKKFSINFDSLSPRLTSLLKSASEPHVQCKVRICALLSQQCYFGKQNTSFLERTKETLYEEMMKAIEMNAMMVARRKEQELDALQENALKEGEVADVGDEFVYVDAKLE